VGSMQRLSRLRNFPFKGRRDLYCVKYRRYYHWVTKPTASEVPVWIDAAAAAAQKLKEALVAEEIYIAAVANSFIPFSYLTKAFQVHEAVLVLCRSGYGSEAVALSRIILEMYMTLRWITNQDQVRRAEDFAYFVAKRKEYAAKTFAKYRPGSPVAADAVKFVENTYKQYADKYGSFSFWSNKPNNLRQLAEEKDILIPELVAPQDDALMLYEIFYSWASDYVHVTAIALDETFPTTGAPYTTSAVRESELIYYAVVYATQWLFYIMIRVDTYRQLGLQDKIDATYKEFAKLFDTL
jgi:hypothetical protein